MHRGAANHGCSHLSRRLWAPRRRPSQAQRRLKVGCGHDCPPLQARSTVSIYKHCLDGALVPPTTSPVVASTVAEYSADEIEPPHSTRHKACGSRVPVLDHCVVCAQTTTEGNLRQNAPATGRDLPRAGEAEGMPDRRRASDAGPCAHVHRDSTQAPSRLGEWVSEGKECHCDRATVRKGEKLLWRTLLGPRLRGVHGRVRTGWETWKCSIAGLRF